MSAPAPARSSPRVAWSGRARRALGITPSPSSSLRLAHRAYVVIACGAPLPQALRLLAAAEPPGCVRAALLARLLQLRRQRVVHAPRWRPEPGAGGLRHAPASLRVLDALLVGRITRTQALADWRIELLSAGLAHLPEQALGPDLQTACAVARRGGDQ